MKVARILAVANAALAIVSALMGAAPFTPAIVLFLVFVPLAALFAHRDQIGSALVVVAAAILAWLLSPIESSHLRSAGPLFGFAWVAAWSCLIIGLSRPRLNALGAAASASSIRRKKSWRSL